MPKRSSKDINETAFAVVQQATQERKLEKLEIKPAETGASPTIAVPQAPLTKPGPSLPTKNEAAVQLGRLGGLKGGVARAKSLSDDRKKEIAKQGALARWKDRKQSST